MEPEGKHQVAVVGAGASGMATAILLAEGGVDVALIEANDLTGKKLLATGNGKCNFTNNFQNWQYPAVYRKCCLLPRGAPGSGNAVVKTL